MSPSEPDLRAALRDGEGDDGPDVDGVIARARVHHSQRRARVLSVATAVAVVAAAGVGGAVLWGGSGDGQQSVGISAGTSPSALPPSSGTMTAGRAGSTESSGAASAGRSATAVSCPSPVPSRSVPAGGLSSGAGGAMFAAPVTTIVVCGSTSVLNTSAPARVASATFTGADATALADSIEQASRSQLHIPCPAIGTDEVKQLAIVAVTADGTRLPTVTTDVSIPNCNQPITNGTAVRWAWKPPTALAARVSTLTPFLPVTGGGTRSGIPVR